MDPIITNGVERSVDSLYCYHCGSHEVGWWNQALGRMICKRCGGTFNIRKLFSDVELPIPPQMTEAPEVTRIEGNTLAFALFDAHLDPFEGIHPSFAVAMKMAEDLKPNIIIAGGDWLELASLSAWEQHKRKLIENRRYSVEIDMGLTQLRRLAEIPSVTEGFFYEGNHEYRVPRYVEEHPEMEGKLEVKEDLRLDDLGFEWVPYNQVRKIGKLNVLHGVYYNVYFARQTLNAIGESCLFGHAHRSQTWVQRLHRDRMPSIAQGCGCLCALDPVWKRGKPTNFVNSFATIEFREGGYFQIHEVYIVGGQASYAGHTWGV